MSKGTRFNIWRVYPGAALKEVQIRFFQGSFSLRLFYISYLALLEPSVPNEDIVALATNHLQPFDGASPSIRVNLDIEVN
jgi:hypothetical protein